VNVDMKRLGLVKTLKVLVVWSSNILQFIFPVRWGLPPPGRATVLLKAPVANDIEMWGEPKQGKCIHIGSMQNRKRGKRIGKDGSEQETCKSDGMLCSVHLNYNMYSLKLKRAIYRHIAQISLNRCSEYIPGGEGLVDKIVQC